MNEQHKIVKINNVIKKIKSTTKKEKLKVSFFGCKFNVRSLLVDDPSQNGAWSNYIVIFMTLAILLTINFKLYDSMNSADVDIPNMFVAIFLVSVFGGLLLNILVSGLFIYLSRVNKLNNKDILGIIYPLKNIIIKSIEENEYNESAIYLVKYYELYQSLPTEKEGYEMIDSCDSLIQDVIGYLESQIQILEDEIKQKVRSNTNEN